MNKHVIVKTRQWLCSANVVTLLVGIAVVLVLGVSSTQAQTETKPPDVVESSVTLLAKGTVNDPGGAITVSGSVLVTAKRVLDNTKVSPALVVLDLDLSNLKGSNGTVKSTTVYVTGENHATEIRPLQASDTIIVTCPYYDSAKDAMSARTMLVTATLNFDLGTGKITGGSITIGNNVVTSTMVGGAASL